MIRACVVPIAAKPILRARGNPSFVVCASTRTCGYTAPKRAALPSVDALSTTTISVTGQVCASSAATTRAIRSPLL
jgi:hypothetical protein